MQVEQVETNIEGKNPPKLNELQSRSLFTALFVIIYLTSYLVQSSLSTPFFLFIYLSLQACAQEPPPTLNF